MPCFSPLTGWVSKDLNETGKRSIVFKYRQGFSDLKTLIPCGRCIGCRIEKSRQWASRCMHEASLHEENCFITLTYTDEYLEKHDTMFVKDNFSLFMKRLRKKFGKGIRFFHSYEYGEKTGRPHHHSIIFNFDFPDKVIESTEGGDKLYSSEILSELWPFGISRIGNVTFESAAYVARYVMKKVTGEKAKEHYGDKVPEYATMSRRPGLASVWYDKFGKDVFPSDEIIIKGFKKCKVPRYYDDKLSLTNKKMYDKVKAKRFNAATKDPEENRFRRLNTKGKVLISKLKLLKREL